MRKNKNSGQWELAPFVAPKPIAKGSKEERFARHRAKFANKTFDVDQENRRASLAAFKVWHRRQQDLLRADNFSGEKLPAIGTFAEAKAEKGSDCEAMMPLENPCRSIRGN